jgi:hypothetical protein
MAPASSIPARARFHALKALEKAGIIREIPVDADDLPALPRGPNQKH